VLAEVRLGASISDALEAMTERVRSEEFRWVVLALNVQREVGGNLAVLLKNVAETLRDREQLRRQVKVLTAEGRISGVILSLLPVGLGLYLAAVNPAYLSALFQTAAGILMVLAALTLLGIGALWMRRLVRIEV
jgi:tight adherence protein B